MPKGQPKKPRIQGDKLPEEQIKILKSIESEIKKSSLFLKKNIKSEKSEKVESEEASETPLTDIKDAIIKTSGDFSKSFSRVANKITEINKNILTLVNDKKKNDKSNTSIKEDSSSYIFTSIIKAAESISNVYDAKKARKFEGLNGYNDMQSSK